MSQQDVDNNDDSKLLENPFHMNEMPKFQNLPMKEYYGQDLFKIIQEGLREVALQQPSNPIKYLGEFLVKSQQK